MFNMYESYMKRVAGDIKKELKRKKTRQEARAFCSTLGLKPSAVKSMDGMFVCENLNQAYLLSRDLISSKEYGMSCQSAELEMFWAENGYMSIFPQGPDFLKFLHDAKMDVRGEDIDLSSLPPSMSFAWPKEFSIDGISPIPCVISLDRYREKQRRVSDRFVRLAKRHMIPKAYARIRQAMWSEDKIQKDLEKFDNEPCLTMLFSDADPYTDVIDIPFANVENAFNKCLTEDFEEVTEGVTACTFTIVMMFRLLVYMQTFPEKVVKGYPDDVLGRLGHIPIPQIQPFHLEGPAIQKQGSHASPKTHMRRWHFRRYPIQKDGTRKKGSVFVHGCIVNEDVDPRTVIA